MKPSDIIDCGLPLKIQKLYIKRLKYMIQRWEFENFCGHCPVNKRFESNAPPIKQLFQYAWKYKTCDFCQTNVRTVTCPCFALKPKEALKRAKDFIERFERILIDPNPK